MPTNTYVALDKVTVTSATPSITFTGISQAYTDLVLVSNFATSTAGPLTYQVGNGSVDTGSNYSRTCLYGDGSSAASFRETNQTYFNTANSSTTLIANDIVHFMNYSNTTTNKTILDRNNNTSGTVQANVYLWRSTSAINTIKIFNSNGYNLAVGSTFSLYGISAIGGVTPKATGGTVTSDATYWYHTFEMSGNFVPNQSLTCDYLVVAGGGGTSKNNGYSAGGGGAGGFRTSIGGSPLSLTAQSYPVTVGGGGAGATSIGYGAQGSNSIFSTITSTGGGRGGAGDVSNPSGGAGGSGGGATAPFGTIGAGTSGQGNNGGYAGSYRGAGGGGAGAVGQDTNGGTGSNGGAGGAGLSSSLSGTSVTYAGGGGGSGVVGGSGGAGGGGTGGTDTSQGANGVTNTGGGAGASAPSSSYNGANGGSGIVIVRYAK